MTASIEVHDLVVRYGDHVAVDGLSLDVDPGSMLALLGPNGAGKTTTIEACLGLRRPDGGSVRVLGLDPRAAGAMLRPRMGVMLQEGGIYPQARPREVLALQAAMFTEPRDVDGLLDRVGLTASTSTRFRDLSGGQQQRLSLALAVVGRPDVAFLDEPTAGLDPAARRSTWDLVRELREAGVAIVLTTHLLDEAEELADEIVIIDHGRAVAAGTPDELMRTHDVVFTTDRAVDRAALSARLGMDVEARGRRGHRIPQTATPGLVEALAVALAEVDTTITWFDGGLGGSLDATHGRGRGRLEDVFLRLTGDGAAARQDVPADINAPRSPRPHEPTSTDARAGDPGMGRR